MSTELGYNGSGKKHRIHKTILAERRLENTA